MTLPTEHIWILYIQRTDAENLIKELEFDFESSNFNLKGFHPTDAALNFVMMA